jgi:CRISPR/Cas system-associated endoribonuclease Cas2
MASYLVSYDLDKPPQKADYHPLVKRIKAWGGERVLYSEWLIIANDTTSVTLRDDLQQFIDASDGLIVVKLTGEGAWTANGMMLTGETIKTRLSN